MQLPPWRQVAPAVNDVDFRALLAAQRIPNGEDALRTLLCESYSASACVLVDSGTSALQVAIESYAPVGESVALPAFGCYDLVTALLGARRNAIFYDLDPLSLSPDLAQLERILSSGVSSLVVAPLYGYAPNMSDIAALCDRTGTKLIMDCAQSAAATFNGRPLASFGSVATLSFGRGKETGGAGGGAILLREGEAVVMERLPMAMKRKVALNVAALSAQLLLANPWIFGIPRSLPHLRLGQTVFRPPSIPTRISKTQALIALAGQSQLFRLAQARRDRAALVESALRYSPHLRFITIAPESSFGALRVAAIASSFDERTMGRIGTRQSYPTTLPKLLGSLRGADVSEPGSFAGADRLAASLVTLPTHKYVAASDLREMVRIFVTDFKL
jgi:perosamine synthetase